MKHIAIVVKDLMYKGCEIHFKCKKCGLCLPRHCYSQKEFESLDCKGGAKCQSE